MQTPSLPLLWPNVRLHISPRTKIQHFPRPPTLPTLQNSHRLFLEASRRSTRHNLGIRFRHRMGRTPRHPSHRTITRTIHATKHRLPSRYTGFDILPSQKPRNRLYENGIDDPSRSFHPKWEWRKTHPRHSATYSIRSNRRNGRNRTLHIDGLIHQNPAQPAHQRRQTSPTRDGRQIHF